MLWRILRSRQLGGYKFRRQYSVAPFILDFACLMPRVGIELDGGGHFEPEKLMTDEERTDWIVERGFHLLRFTNVEVLFETEAVLQTILSKLEELSK